MNFDVHQDIHTVLNSIYTEYLGDVLSYVELKVKHKKHSFPIVL